MFQVRLVATVAVVVFAQSCTTRAWYEGMKSGHNNDCTLAPVSEQRECTAAHEDNYYEFQTKRELILEGQE